MNPIELLDGFQFDDNLLVGDEVNALFGERLPTVFDENWNFGSEGNASGAQLDAKGMMVDPLTNPGRALGGRRSRNR